MSSVFGNILKVSTFGESHGGGIGVIVDGAPSGLELTEDIVQLELDKRRPGTSRFVSPRKEADRVEILSGVVDGRTIGTPIMMLIRNTNQQSKDYGDLLEKFRPGHADYTYFKKYGVAPLPGGGRSSGRETAGRVAAGVVARQIPEAVARAGMRQVGIGALLGLNDWRYEALCVATHADVLIRNFWKTRVSVSFPRMRPAEEVNPEWLRPVTDRNLTQIILAIRLCFSDVGLVLSTRESQQLRDDLLPLGLTRISAGSKTNPGGYKTNEELEGTEQFAIADERTPEQVVKMLIDKGFDPVWKDWDSTYFRAAN